MFENAPRMDTIKNVAKAFDLPEHFVRQKVRNGEVVAVKAGSKYLVNMDKFAEYLNTNTVTKPTKSPADDTAAETLKDTVRVNNPKPTTGITLIPAKLR